MDRCYRQWGVEQERAGTGPDGEIPGAVVRQKRGREGEAAKGNWSRGCDEEEPYIGPGAA